MSKPIRPCAEPCPDDMCLVMSREGMCFYQEPVTIDEVKEALRKGADERTAAERIMKRSPRR